MTQLFIDLDDVLADFSGQFRRTFGMEHEGLEDDYFWSLIDGHGSFFRDLPPAANALEFYSLVEPLNPVILTACPADKFADVAAQKRAWVREYLGNVPMIPCPGSRHKQFYMNDLGDVLIDDHVPNIDRWRKAGGHGILHCGNFAATSRSLTDYLWPKIRSARATNPARAVVRAITSPATTTDTPTASLLGANIVSGPEEKPFRLTPADPESPPNCC